MAVEILMKNIFTFINVLKRASEDDISNWGDANLRNAFKWAKFCETVYDQSQNRSYRNDLDHKISELNGCIDRPYISNLNLRHLSLASALLAQAIVGNGCSSDGQLDAILCGLHGELNFFPGDFGFFREISEQIGAERFLELAREFREQNTFENSEAVDGYRKASTFLDLCLSVRRLHREAESLHQGERGSRFKITIERLLSRISRHNDGWYVILYALLDGRDYDGISDIRDDIVVWINESVDHVELDKCGLLRVNEKLLYRVMREYSMFRSLYTRLVAAWAESMTIRYRPSGPLPRYDWVWPDVGSDHLCYSRLMAHLCELFVDLRVSSDLWEHVGVLSSQSRPNIWSDMLLTLDTCKKVT